MKDGELLTLVEGEREFKVSRDTLRRRVKSGALPHRRMLGKIVVTRRDLERVLFDRADHVDARASTK